MLLTKDGITVDVSHPTDVARFKRLGYKTEKELEAGKPKPEQPDDFAASQQAEVEKALQPTKGGKAGKS